MKFDFKSIFKLF